MIRLTIPITPVAWQRVRRDRHGTVYVPTKTRRFEADCAMLIRKMIGPTTPRRGPLSLTARFVVPHPKRPKWPTPAVRPDLDNYVKALKDAASGVLWLDDAQVVHLDARKLYDMSGGKPRIELELTEVTQ